MELPGDCRDCPKYKTCTEPCEKILPYINQDYRFAKEMALSELELDVDMFSEEIGSVWATYSIDYWDLDAIRKKYKLTDKQFDILFDYFIEGMTQVSIAKKVGITHQSISKFIKKTLGRLSQPRA